MAEGPLVHVYAKQLARALKNRRVEVAFGIKSVAGREPEVSGRTVVDAEAYGKQTRIHFENDRIILVHLMMWGSWRIYRHGAEWDKPEKQVRLVLRTNTHDAVCFSAPVVRLFTPEELAADPRFGQLGPDPLRPDFSHEAWLDGIAAEADREIGEVLLDQHVVSGIGNMLRIEILWKSHVHPQRLVRELTDAQKRELLRWTLHLMHRWAAKIRGKKDWLNIYRRSGQPCPRCGAPIEYFRQKDRITFACARCQK